MNIVIIILLVIAGIIVLLLLLALFVRKSYTIEREITINKPRNEVFNYIKHLKNQDHYNKWAMTDPGKKKDFRGTDGTVGFVYAWDGNKKAGKGEQEIMRIVEGERLDVEIRFVKPFEAVGNTPFITEALPGNQTKVKWGMSSRLKYPMNIMLLMNLEKMLGKDLQTSLGNLKRILEK
jgi:uncharacterized protein YndB with AHSA1/START domain